MVTGGGTEGDDVNKGEVYSEYLLWKPWVFALSGAKALGGGVWMLG